MAVEITAFFIGENMTVPVSDRLSQLYVGNGANTRFDFTFRVFQQEGETGIAVRQKGVTEFDTIDPSTYSVSVNQDGMGGFITFITAPAIGSYFYIAGLTVLDQLLDITNYDNFYPEAIERALDKLTALLQERSTEIDLENQARILADIHYDALAMEREADLENRLISYINAMIGITNPAIFDGISDRMIITQDGRTQREFNESIPFWTGDYVNFKQETYLREEQILDHTNQKVEQVDISLTSKVLAETVRAQDAEDSLLIQLNAVGVGNKAYTTYALMDADKTNIPAKSKVTVTNDATESNNGDWQWDGTTLTKSAFDPVKQANQYTKEKTEEIATRQYTSADLAQWGDSNWNKVMSIGSQGELKPSSIQSVIHFLENENSLPYHNKRVAYQFPSKDGYALFNIYTDGTTSVDENVDAKIVETIEATVDQNPRFNLHRLRELRRKRQQLKRTDNTVLRVGCFGDSWTDNRLNWISEVSEQLKDKYGNGGHWFGFGSLNNAVSDTISGTCNVGAGWANIDFTVPSPHLRAVTTSTNGSTITVNTPLTGNAKLCAKGVAGSSIRYKWGDGAYTTVNLTAADTTIWNDLGVVNGILTIESASGSPVLYGVYVETVKGVVLNKFAAASTKVSQWNAVDAQQFKDAVAGFNLDVAIILFGTNDVYSYDGQAYVSTYLPVLISRIKDVAPNCDVLIATPPVNLSTNIAQTGSSSLLGYRDAVRKFAKDNYYTHLSIQEFFGESVTEYGETGTQYFISSDLNHPATNGKAVLAETFLQTLEYN